MLVFLPSKGLSTYFWKTQDWKRGEGRDSSICLSDGKLKGVQTFMVC